MTITIRDKSIGRFLANVIRYDDTRSPEVFFKRDDLYILAESYPLGTKISFILSETTNITDQSIITYIDYEVVEYDSILSKLKMIRKYNNG